MHSLEFNKFAAAILVAVLLGVVITKLGGIVYHVESPEEMSYIVEVDQPEGSVEESGAPAMSFDQVLVMADPAGGEKIFKSKCTSCHIDVEGETSTKSGPNLWGVVGREVASVPGFGYSDALKGLGGTWTYERLNEFLTGPRAYAPGTKMTFAGLSDMAQRAQLVAWLRTMSSDQVPLPDVEMDAAGAQVDGDDVGEMDSESAASDETMEAIENTSDETTDAVNDAAGDAVDAVKDAADSASDAIENAADSVSDAVNNAAAGASDAVDSVTGDDNSNN